MISAVNFRADTGRRQAAKRRPRARTVEAQFALVPGATHVPIRSTNNEVIFETWPYCGFPTRHHLISDSQYYECTVNKFNSMLDFFVKVRANAIFEPLLVLGHTKPECAVYIL